MSRMASIASSLTRITCTDRAAPRARRDALEIRSAGSAHFPAEFVVRCFSRAGPQRA